MVGKLLLRGLLVGLVAGLITFVYARVYGEPPVDTAIVFEESLAAAEPADPAMAEMEEEGAGISRETQRGTGLLTGMVVMGVGLGGLFSILFALAYGRMGGLGALPTSVVLAGLAFLTFGLVPWLKYPANPPASTFDDTVAFRSSLYFLMLAVSVAAMLAAWIVRRQLLPTRGGWNATLIAAAVYVAVVWVFHALLPTVNEVPEGFPTAAMWDFRMAALGIQAVMWASLGVLFGLVAERTLALPAARRTAAAH